MRKFLMIVAVFGGLFAIEPAVYAQNNPNDLPSALDYLKSDKSTDRAFALSVLGLLGGDAVSASKQVVQSYFDSDSEVRRAASLALKDVNPPLYGPVQTLTAASDPANVNLYSNQLQALQALSNLGAAGSAALPALLAFMPRMAAADQAKLVGVVATCAPNDPEARAALVNWALTSTNPAVRAEAMKVLPKVNDSAAVIDTFLTALNREKDPKRRIEIIGGLSGIGRGNPQVKRTFEGLLADRDPNIRKAAKDALAKLQGKGK